MSVVPKDFEHAYESLMDLVGRISQGEVPQQALGEKVSEWEQADCRGAGTLAEAALKALRYELAKTGLEKGEEAVAGNLRSLGRVEAILHTSELREVPLPEQLRQAVPQGRGFRMGELQIIFEPSAGPPYGHLSVSYPARYPTFEELLGAARAPGGPPPNLWALVPKPEELERMHPYTVHLYVLPPEELLR